jgi:hypothetical protein
MLITLEGPEGSGKTSQIAADRMVGGAGIWSTPRVNRAAIPLVSRSGT